MSQGLTATVFDWAAEQPAKTALVYNGVSHSYRRLADGIAEVRGAFAADGVQGPGVAVMAISNLVDFWVATLALRSLGLTCILITGADDLAVLGVPDVRLVVTTTSESWPGLPDACAKAGLPLLTTSLRGGQPLGLGDGPQLPPGGFVMLTSGTTGVFKKVLIEPSFEEGFLRRRWEIIEADRSSTVAVFDFAPWTGAGYRCPAAAWLAGATVVLDQGRGQHACLEHPGITHATIIPTKLAQVLEAPEGAFPRSDILRLSITAGTVTQAQIDETKRRVTPHVYNWLGATEGQIMAYTRFETPEDHRWHRLMPGAEVVDDDGRPVGVGETGRVRLSTAGGPNGYMHDAEASAEFFQGGYFYPGDLAVLREDGRMGLQGRVTSVINLAGQKLSPEPIEDQLREALGVSGACLVSAQDRNGDEQLHLVLETPTRIPRETVADALRACLPWPVGVELHFIRTLPRNIQGKMLRKQVTDQLRAAADR